ncbi:MAG: DUF2892 domain-containing protein [Bryobacterales bacterium]|nr:DUF2892 domain-containing protein [Bryobacterales bacterium]
MFAKNEGPVDRGVRVVVGLGLLGLALTGQTPWGYIGVVPLVTGLIGSCPAYRIFGISTCPMQKHNS